MRSPARTSAPSPIASRRRSRRPTPWGVRCSPGSPASRGPSDPYGRLWRACDLLREHRGDGHIAASIAAGLDPVAMNVLTELWVGMPFGTYSATRGWSTDQLAAAAARLRSDGLLAGDELSDRGREWRDGLEATTDAMEGGLVDAIGPGLDDVVAQLDEWSRRCIAAAAFPPDVFKRAAG